MPREELLMQFRVEMEQVIIDHAAQLLNKVATRRDHPSYGVTRYVLHAIYEQMEGQIGLYMVLTGQAFHANIPATVTFLDPVVTSRVHEARVAFQES